MRHPGSSLCEVPLLLLQPDARKVFTKDLHDPVGLQPFWHEWDHMTEGQRLQAAGPVLNKLRPVLLRPTVRNIMGQSRSTVALAACIHPGAIPPASPPKRLLSQHTTPL